MHLPHGQPGSLRCDCPCLQLLHNRAFLVRLRTQVKNRMYDALTAEAHSMADEVKRTLR